MTSLGGGGYIQVKGQAPTLMSDLFYIALALLFLIVCWFFTKACDRL
jgi:hypothetical protein